MVELEYVGQCDVCGEIRAGAFFTGRDYRFGYDAAFTFVRCETCGLLYLNPRPTPTAIIALYERYYTPDGSAAPLVPPTTTPKWQRLRRMWHRISGNYTDAVRAAAAGRVLDIGCGSGEKFLWPLKQAGLEVHGVEPNARHAAVHRHLDVPVFYGDLQDAGFRDRFFDTIILSQVIEHVPSPRRLLMEVRRILAPGGKALVYCPNAEGYLRWGFGRYWHGWHIPFHFYVFSASTLAALASDVGLEARPLAGVTPDDFLSTSLRAVCGNGADSPRLARYLDAIPIRGMLSLSCRIADLVLPGHRDCLAVELVRR